MNLTLRAVCATFSLLLGTCALGNFTQRSATNAALIAANDLFPLQGHLGTSLGAVDANGTVAEQTGADAYGVLDGAASQNTPTAIKQAHLYTGEYWDADAQLLYLRARWYDPSLGRFISADPFEGRQSDPRSLNRYAYAHNDPVHGRDPSGMMSMGEQGAAANVQGTLSSIAVSNVARNGLDFVRKVKIYDVYDYVRWPLHFYMYAELTRIKNGTRYDVGNREGWGGVLKRNPFGIMPGGFVRAKSVTNRQGIDGRGVKIVSLSFIQWLTWHVSVVGTDQPECTIYPTYSFTPGIGTNCLSWTIWASAKALAISRLPL